MEEVLPQKTVVKLTNFWAVHAFFRNRSDLQYTRRNVMIAHDFPQT